MFMQVDDPVEAIGSGSARCLWPAWPPGWPLLSGSRAFQIRVMPSTHQYVKQYVRMDGEQDTSEWTGAEVNAFRTTVTK